MNDVTFEKAREIKSKIARLKGGIGGARDHLGELIVYDIPQSVIDLHFKSIEAWVNAEINRLKKEFAELQKGETTVEYATLRDLKAMFDLAILGDKFHIAITIEKDGRLESFVYSQGITTEAAVWVIKTGDKR